MTAPTRIARPRDGTASIAASRRVSSPATVAAARARRKAGATMPSLSPLSTLRSARSRSGTRRSRTKATAGARSTGITIVASTARSQTPTPPIRTKPASQASRSDSGRAIRRSRSVRRGSRPRTPPGTSVASVNSRIARMTSTTCSADSNSMSKVNTGLDPAVSRMPATSIASGIVTLNRARRPAISAQTSSISMMTTSASIGPPAVGLTRRSPESRTRAADRDAPRAAHRRRVGARVRRCASARSVRAGHAVALRRRPYAPPPA